ncbi:glycosyltransferase family 2 protein [Paludibacter sp.]|uniref:glycosyltransferase family 2 protein n=1 Tax=Paludibacter sp. TaxID=1898105 RepID=UPI0013525C42|nr:glycosyltransferase family 2 protein [Paludibacter sp.]MTK53267.1 glycosyltransferase family 2 protein [Paludibacter sp.]
METISVICPTYNERQNITQCIESIVSSSYEKDKMEVVFVDGMSNDGTRDIIIRYTRQYPYISMLDNPKKSAPSALNIGIRATTGNIIIRLDAHATYPPDYFGILVTCLINMKADNVGVTIKSLPLNNSLTANAIAMAVSSRFGVGNSYCRIGTDKLMEVDTVPFGCFHRELFSRIGMFDEELIRNQDDEFNARIIKNGGKIFLIPDIKVIYYPRDEVSKIAKMFYQYGLFKPLVNKKNGKPATIRQFFPLLFLLGLLFGGAMAFQTNTFLWIYICFIGLYFTTAVGFAQNKIEKHQPKGLLLMLPWVFFVMHISYGWGYLVGMLKLLVHSNFYALVNR